MRAIRKAVRSPDPAVSVSGSWVVRRIAPHCTKVELSDLEDNQQERRLLFAMGYETANIHLGSSKKRKELLADVSRLSSSVLSDVCERMLESVTDDWKVWCSKA